MPIPFIIAGIIAAGTAIATSKNCRRCDSTFWNSDCSSYCQSCCEERAREREIEEEELRQKQERDRERERSRSRREAESSRRREAESSRRREEERKKDERERQKKAERNRLKAIADREKAKIKATEDEREKQKLILNKRANKERENILNTLITDFKKCELSQYKEKFQKNIFLEIDKEKNFQLKKINESQKLMLSDKDFKEQIEIYIEEE